MLYYCYFVALLHYIFENNSQTVMLYGNFIKHSYNEYPTLTNKVPV